MKKRLDTEFIAIPMVIVLIGALFLLFRASIWGLWAWLLAGVLILVALGLAAMIADRRWRHPPVDDVPHVARIHEPGTFSVLVVSDTVCAPETIRAHVTAHAAGRTTRVFVVAPALGSRLDRLTGDEGAHTRAAEQLEATLAALEGVTDSAAGEVGSHDPIQAIDEALRKFPADEIVLAVDPEGARNWLEHDIVGIARERYDIPVTPIAVAA